MSQRDRTHRDARIPVLVIGVWLTVLVSVAAAVTRYAEGEAAGMPGVLVAGDDRVLLTGEPPLAAGAVAAPRLVALVSGTVPVNRAGEAVLQIVPGIGPELARRIVAERHRSGKFDDPEELTRVRGIGPVRSRQFREYLLFD